MPQAALPGVNLLKMLPNMFSQARWVLSGKVKSCQFQESLSPGAREPGHLTLIRSKKEDTIENR